MIEFLKYVLRGMLGGMIVPILWSILLFGLGGPLFLVSFSDSWKYVLGPGALVGLLIWLCSLVFERLGLIARIATGAGVLSAIAMIRSLDSYLPNGERPPHFGQTLAWFVVNFAVSGALSGLACPGGRFPKREPKLTYRERVRMYEEAEAEAKRARERLR